MMRSSLVLWEASSWNKIDWLESQLLYVSPAPPGFATNEL